MRTLGLEAMVDIFQLAFGWSLNAFSLCWFLIASGRALSVTWSPDGCFIYSGSSDGYVFLDSTVEESVELHSAHYGLVIFIFFCNFAGILDAGMQSMAMRCIG